MARIGIYQLGGMLSSGYYGANVFVLAGDKVTLVDTGFRSRASALLRNVGRLGYAHSDIVDIIVTHYHTGHTGGLALIQAMTGAKVCAHPADTPFIEGNAKPPQHENPGIIGKIFEPILGLYKYIPVKVDTQLNDGVELPILGGVKVIHTPGHTPGSISLYIQERKMLIVGDALVHRFKLGQGPDAFTFDKNEEVKSVRKLLEFDFEVVCFGHGTPLKRNARKRIENYARTLAQKYKV